MSAATFRLRSKAYRRGLIQGFGAPIFFFVPRAYPRSSKIDPSLKEAWDEVSRALNDTLEAERDSFGKIENTNDGKRARKELAGCAAD